MGTHWRLGRELPILRVHALLRTRNWLSRALLRRPAPSGRGRRPRALRACGKDFVNPVDWEPVTPEAWWMLLRCGECHTFREVTVTNTVAERFDLELDRRADMLQRALHKLDTRAHARSRRRP